MRSLIGLVCSALFVTACDDGAVLHPSAPSPSSTRSILSPSIRPISAPHQNAHWRVPSVFETMSVTDAILSRVTADDPACDPAWPFHCQYFRLTAPSDGLFEVVMKWSSLAASSYPLDIDVSDSDGWTWDCLAGPGTQRSVKLRVEAGKTYWVSVWSFEAPGEEFELSFSLQSE